MRMLFSAQNHLDDAAAKLNLNPNIHRILRTCERSLTVSVPIETDDGNVEVYTGYRVQPDLAGVTVYVYPLKNDADPETMLAKKHGWEKFFMRSGAVKVHFLTPNVVATNGKPSQCTP